jgi:hypothetical protein
MAYSSVPGINWSSSEHGTICNWEYSLGLSRDMRCPPWNQRR